MIRGAVEPEKGRLVNPSRLFRIKREEPDTQHGVANTPPRVCPIGYKHVVNRMSLCNSKGLCVGTEIAF